MQIALCQFNPLVGAIVENKDRLLNFAKEAHARGASLIIAPELALSGYPPKDILLIPEFQTQIEEALAALAQASPLPFLLGAPIARGDKTGQPYWNAAVLCENKSWRVVAQKQLLPNYEVFDERRYFEPPKEGESPALIEVSGLRFGVTICEESWNDATFFAHRRYEADPMAACVQKGAQVLINIACSPFSPEKPAFRERMLAHISKRHGVALLMSGQCGANDSIIFDGSSLAIDHLGQTKARLAPFEEGLLFVTIGEDAKLETTAEVSEDLGRLEWMRQALVCGIADYFRKCGAKGALIGLSGGIDSALCATLAVEALGAKNVVGVRLPSAFSSKHSLDDAEALASNLGIALKTIAIEPHVNALRKALGPLKDLSDQNLQSRMRGLLLMALSNESGKLVLATGNKSELAVGYCTLYGDTCGALLPLGDVLKSDVWALARHINGDKVVIPESSITKTPSAELKEGQSDQDTLPPYNDLDAILRLYLDENQSLDAIQKATGLPMPLIEQVTLMVQKAEFKRGQSPLILGLSNHFFGQARRWPIAHRFLARPK